MFFAQPLREADRRAEELTLSGRPATKEEGSWWTNPPASLPLVG